MPPDQWISPTGHNDPDEKWTNPQCAYDGNTSLAASHLNTLMGTFSSFLELTIDAIQCSKARFWGNYTGNFYTVDFDVYYDGAWHDVFEGAAVHLAWNEFDLGGTFQVTKARYRQKRIGNTGTVYCNEVAFWEITAPPPPSIETQDATGIKSDQATLATKVLDDKGKTLSVRHNYGKTTEYGKNTPWQEGKHTNDIISQTVTELEPETEYHFRGEAVYED